MNRVTCRTESFWFLGGFFLFAVVPSDTIFLFHRLTCGSSCQSPPGEGGSLQHIRPTEHQRSCHWCFSKAAWAKTPTPPHLQLTTVTCLQLVLKTGQSFKACVQMHGVEWKWTATGRVSQTTLVQKKESGFFFFTDNKYYVQEATKQTRNYMHQIVTWSIIFDFKQTLKKRERWGEQR